MSKSNEVTSKQAASAAAKTLNGTGTAKDAKSAAGSALTQRPSSSGSKKK